MMDDEKKQDEQVAPPAPAETAAARRVGYLKSLLMMNRPALAEKFSSTPLDPEASSAASSQLGGGGETLTQAERTYLESLLQRGDNDLIERASQRLCDPLLFPPLDPCHRNAAAAAAASPSNSEIATTPAAAAAADNSTSSGMPRRNSQLQQELFRLHEKSATRPSRLLQRMNDALRNSLIEDDNTTVATESDGAAVTVAAAAAAAAASLNEETTTGVVTTATTTTTTTSPQQQQQQPEATTVENTTTTEKNEATSEPTASESAPAPAAAAAAVTEDGHNDDDDDDASSLVEDEKTPDDEPSPTPPASRHVSGTSQTSETSSIAPEQQVERWNPFKDVSSWLDGSQGFEVGDNGIPHASSGASSTGAGGANNNDGDPNQHGGDTENEQHFRILGTAADDVSCHPHVLSPPLMESLLAFVPESLSADYHFWLKYSLVRDGANLWTLLRQVRASDTAFLAIETTDGHVFGSYTSSAWRLAAGWYGHKESFLWKMRHSRLETCRSIVEQANQESEIQVFPYRAGNVAVQYCHAGTSPTNSQNKDATSGSGAASAGGGGALMLGQGELLPQDGRTGEYYGHGLWLDGSLMHGTTSTSETFGNPCLLNDSLRGAYFDVSNIEVWTLTPHTTVKEAEQSELSTLFLEDGSRDGMDKNLNIMNILVGGPI